MILASQEARTILEARKRERDNEWLRNQLGEPTYLLSLRILGYSPADAETELSMLRMHKAERAPKPWDQRR